MKERRSSAGGQPEDADLLVPYKTLQDGGYVVVRELGRGGQGVMYLGKKPLARKSIGKLSNAPKVAGFERNGTCSRRIFDDFSASGRVCMLVLHLL